MRQEAHLYELIPDTYTHVCRVFLREESIRNRWKDLLQQLQEQRGLLGNVVVTLSILRDIDHVSQELKELQVSSCGKQEFNF